MADQSQTPAKTTPVRLTHDVWFKDDERTPAGAVVSVSLEEAKALIAAGKAERNDPLPGEFANDHS
ncbi:hypothetical protein [Ensifer canadensis]